MNHQCAPKPEPEEEDVVVPVLRVVPPSVEPAEVVASLAPTVVDTNPPLPLLPALVPLVDVAEPAPEQGMQCQNAGVNDVWIPAFGGCTFSGRQSMARHIWP